MLRRPPRRALTSYSVTEEWKMPSNVFAGSLLPKDWSSKPIVKLIGARHRESSHSWFIYCRFSEVLWWTDRSQVTISLYIFFAALHCTLSFLLFLTCPSMLS